MCFCVPASEILAVWAGANNSRLIHTTARPPYLLLCSFHKLHLNLQSGCLISRPSFQVKSHPERSRRVRPKIENPARVVCEAWDLPERGKRWEALRKKTLCEQPILACVAPTARGQSGADYS